MVVFMKRHNCLKDDLKTVVRFFGNSVFDTEKVLQETLEAKTCQAIANVIKLFFSFVTEIS